MRLGREENAGPSAPPKRGSGRDDKSRDRGGCCAWDDKSKERQTDDGLQRKGEIDHGCTRITRIEHKLKRKAAAEGAASVSGAFTLAGSFRPGTPSNPHELVVDSTQHSFAG